MLIVKPIQNKNTQKEYCEKCGANYLPDSLAYYAEVDGTLVGVCQFSLHGGVGTIQCITERPDSNDWEAMFIMGRAAMSYIEVCGIYDCFCSDDAADEASIHRLGFKRNEDGKLYVCLKGFFNDHCKNH